MTVSPSAVRGIRLVIALVITLLIALVWIQRGRQGTEQMITASESVLYSGSVTTAEARALGSALQKVGYLDGATKKVVRFSKSAEEGMVVSFVVSAGAWDRAEVEAEYHRIAEAVAPDIGGPPLVVRLLDVQLNVKKEIQIAKPKSATLGRYRVSTKESILYAGSATLEEAKALGQALQEAGYLSGVVEKDVLLTKDDKATVVSFVVGEGTWDQPEAVEVLRGTAEGVAPAIGGKPIVVRLVDGRLRPQKELLLE